MSSSVDRHEQSVVLLERAGRDRAQERFSSMHSTADSWSFTA